MKAMLNETFGSGECWPNPFPLLWSYRRSCSYVESRFLACFLLLQLFVHHFHGFLLGLVHKIPYPQNQPLSLLWVWQTPMYEAGGPRSPKTSMVTKLPSPQHGQRRSKVFGGSVDLGFSLKYSRNCLNFTRFHVLESTPKWRIRTNRLGSICWAKRRVNSAWLKLMLFLRPFWR